MSGLCGKELKHIPTTKDKNSYQNLKMSKRLRNWSVAQTKLNYQYIAEKDRKTRGICPYLYTGTDNCATFKGCQNMK